MKVETHLLVRDKDLLFPIEQSVSNAKKYISTLKEGEIFPNVGHCIKIYDKAIRYIGNKIKH